ncbi:MAG TPA: phosphoribosyl-ATP pyrophosphohydrolase [Flexivirga sp.]|uniref:phosphoribosyl-ATP pyrophosphohydrolase n=1 Tax=Flexivirga sp. TaxID=1962927 RepID=UPI002BD63502|nr:phosphoribosyl-ATP pyrophosphohydrolase [Flexivirga sp.]HWC24323.1 phosphoribosyl-ATP pyrophosphohydrolase [Flexivirga sp.]
MDIAEWTSRLEDVSAGYAEVYAVDRTPDWMLLKLMEELGELSQAWLVASGRGRDRNLTEQQQHEAVAAECADVVAMALLVAHRMGVDVESAMRDKWLAWEEFHAKRRANAATTPPITLDSNAFQN